MNFGGSVSNYKWELVGVNIETNERIAFPCSPNSIGTLVNQIAIEDADGLWEIPEGINDDLINIISDGTMTLELISKIAKADQEKLKRYLNDDIPNLKLPAESVIMLMELSKNLNSEKNGI